MSDKDIATRRAAFKKRFEGDKDEAWADVDQLVAMAYSQFSEENISFEKAVRELIKGLSGLL